jgi:predicted nucleotide-binding protein
MANRRYPPGPTPEAKRLTANDIDRGIAKLGRRIEDIDKLESERVVRDDARVRTVEGNISETIREIFGPASAEFNEHKHYRIWHGGFNYLDDDHLLQHKFEQGLGQARTMLHGLIDRLKEKREDLDARPAPEPASARPGDAHAASSRKVFLVHGHDQAALHSVARYLARLGLNPVVLSEVPSEGRTIIEKFEKNSDVAFAVVMMTPDDVGHPAGQLDQARPRARQNVVLELGYFVGRLGRANVAVLHKGNLELPSDYHGVVFIEMDEHDGWQIKLAREMKQAGVDADWSAAL